MGLRFRLRRPAEAVVLVALALLAVVLVVDRTVRRSSTASGAIGGRHTVAGGLADNPYWAGYVVTAPRGAYVSYRSVTGTWKVPTVTCTRADAGAASAIWVGLGGYNAGSRVLEQVGVNANCDAAGKPLYFAWHELLPDIARNVTARVLAGDTITGSVRILDHGLVELRIDNRTRNWTFRQRITWGNADTSTAEWILEAPNTCHRNTCHQARLADFGSVRMDAIQATDTSSSGTLSNRAWAATSIRLVPDTRPAYGQAGGSRVAAGAVAGRPTSDGKTFEIAWVPDAKNG